MERSRFYYLAAEMNYEISSQNGTGERSIDVNSAIRKRCQGSIEIGILSGQGDSIVKSRRKSRRYNYTPGATNHSPVESMLRMGPNASAQDIFNMRKLTMVNLDTDI